MKLNNLEKIGVAEQMVMRGGLSEEIIYGWYLVEVEVVAKIMFDSSKFIWDNVNFKDIGKIDWISGGITTVNSAYTCPILNYPFEDRDHAISQNNTKDTLKLGNMQLASDLLNNPNVTAADIHFSKAEDKASAEQNLMDASKGLLVHTSDYGKAPGLMVALSPALMAGVLALAHKFEISISEIAGGDHSANSSHYKGLSIDVNFVNGIHVDNKSMESSEIIAFRNAAYAVGAKVVLDPVNEPKNHFNHFHIQW
ncbi:MAG: hypothetical protein WCP85_06720 [Mariniphaga sp.]